MAGAWWAKAVSDDQRGSILNNAVAETVQKSVLARCGAQAGVDEGLVTDPVACDWRPEMIACPADKSDAGCLTPRQVDAIKKMMSPFVNSKGKSSTRIRTSPERQRNGPAGTTVAAIPLRRARTLTTPCTISFCGTWPIRPSARTSIR